MNVPSSLFLMTAADICFKFEPIDEKAFHEVNARRKCSTNLKFTIAQAPTIDSMSGFQRFAAMVTRFFIP